MSYNPVMQYRVNPLFDNLATSPTLYINERVNRLLREGRRVFHLGFGESRFAVHPKLQNALTLNAHQKSYLPCQGLPELREQIANFYNRRLGIQSKADQVMVGPGSKALIYALQMALDAELLLPVPCWVSYAPQAQMLNRSLRYIPAAAENGYRFSLEQLDKTVRSSGHPCKLLVINNPNNPTGTSLPSQLLKELADYCREQHILVLSDEIYFLINHGHTPHRSIAEYYPEGTFVLGGLSKHLSIGGWRFGTAILPDNHMGRDLMNILKVIASEIWSSVASPVQYAAQLAYSDDPKINRHMRECSELHGIRTRHLYQALTDLDIRCPLPDGAFYMVANFDRWREELTGKQVVNAEQLAEYLLQKHGLATLPGSAFGIAQSELSLRLATSYLDMEEDQDSDRLLNLYQNGLEAEEIMSPHHHPNMHGAISAFSNFLAELSTL